MISVVIAIVLALGVSAVAVYSDQRLLRCGTPLRLVCAVALLAIAAWTISIILAADLLHIPGAYGPVQFWVGSSEAYSFMNVRVLTLFLLVPAGFPLFVLTVIAMIASLFFKSNTSRRYRLLIPGIALCAFGIAWYMFVEYYFFPSA